MCRLLRKMPKCGRLCQDQDGNGSEVMVKGGQVGGRRCSFCSSSNPSKATIVEAAMRNVPSTAERMASTSSRGRRRGTGIIIIFGRPTDVFTQQGGKDLGKVIIYSLVNYRFSWRGLIDKNDYGNWEMVS